MELCGPVSAANVGEQGLLRLRQILIDEDLIDAGENCFQLFFDSFEGGRPESAGISSAFEFEELGVGPDLRFLRAVVG